MRIGFVLDSGEFGGAERQAYLLGRELKKSGHSIHFFYLKSDNSEYLNDLLSTEGIQSHDLDFEFTETHFARFFHCIRLAIKLRKYKVDIFLPYTIRPNVNINFVWQLTGAKKSFWNQRDIGFGFSKKYRDRILWFALKNTSGYMSNSDGGLEFLKSYLPEKKPSIVIKNGVESVVPRNSQTLKKDLGIQSTDFVILMLANLTRYKDHITLLKAWIELALPDAKLILAGSHGETYTDIIHFIETNKVDNVILPGPLDSKSAIQIADICILSSEREGLPNSILEAMAFSKSVIATNNSGNIEALGIDYPYLFEFGNSHQLAEMIKTLKSNDDMRRRTGISNAERLTKEFSLSALVNETLKFIGTP